MKNNNKKIVQAIVIFVVSFLLSLVFIFSSSQRVATDSANDAISFLNQLIRIPSKWIEGIGLNISNLLSDYQVNAMSRQNMDEAKTLQKELILVKQENEQLKKQLKIDYTLSDYDKINAHVISRTPDMFYEQLIINVGMANAVQAGMAVLSQGVIIGRIESVSNSSAKVLLLASEKQPNLSVKIDLDNGEYTIGVLTGYDAQTQEYIVSNIANDSEIKIGNQVTTSGFSQLIPSKLLVGEITAIGLEETSTFKQARIKSANSINDIQYVSVIKKSLESVTNE